MFQSRSRGVEIPLTILHINNLQGHLENIPRQAYLIKKIVEENIKNKTYTLVLGGGDIIGGTTLSTLYQGQPAIQALNLCGYNAAVIGDREFDYGQNNLKQLMETANFPFLSANIVSREGEAFLAASHVVHKGPDFKIAIFGLSPPATVISHSRDIKGLRFLDPIDTAKKLVPRLRKKAKTIILLSHLGQKADKILAQEVHGINLILGVDSDPSLKNPFTVNNVLISSSAGSKGELIGRLNIKLKRGKIVSSSSELIPVDEKTPEDPAVSHIIKEYLGRSKADIKKSIGQSATAMIAAPNKIRYKETNFGDLITDIMRNEVDADLALINSAILKGSIYPGSITFEYIWRILPYDSKLVIMDLTGEQIKQALLNNINCYGKEGFLQVSGLSFKFANKSLKQIKIGEEPLDLKKLYRVALDDSLARGEFGYSVFKSGKNIFSTGRSISDLLIRWIRKNKEVRAGVGERIQIVQ